MSGSGGGRGDYSGSFPIGSGGSSGAEASSGGNDPCAIVQNAPLNSPNPTVVSSLSVGDVLDVVLTGTAPHQVLEVRDRISKAAAGSLTHRGHLAIIRCIETGKSYRAEVIQRTGGAVVVRIEPA